MILRRSFCLTMATLVFGFQTPLHAEEPQEQPINQALATAGLMTAAVGTVGLLFVYHDIDKAIGPRYSKLAEEVSQTENTKNFLFYKEMVDEIRKKIADLHLNPLETPEATVEELRRLNKDLIASIHIRELFARISIQKFVHKNLSGEEYLRIFTSHEKALGKMKSRVYKSYSRTNPLYMLAIGGSVLAFAAIATPLAHTDLATLYPQLSPSDQEQVMDVLAYELKDRAHTLDELVAQ